MSGALGCYLADSRAVMGHNRIRPNLMPGGFGFTALTVAVLSFSGLEPLTVQPWLAVVAMRMMPIKISPINALRVRSPGMRILYIYSVLVLRFWLACGEPMGHTPPCENRRWQYIPTDVAQYSIGSGVAGPSDLSPEYRFSPFVLK